MLQAHCLARLASGDAARYDRQQQACLALVRDNTAIPKPLPCTPLRPTLVSLFHADIAPDSTGWSSWAYVRFSLPSRRVLG